MLGPEQSRHDRDRGVVEDVGEQQGEALHAREAGQLGAEHGAGAARVAVLVLPACSRAWLAARPSRLSALGHQASQIDQRANSRPVSSRSRSASSRRTRSTSGPRAARTSGRSIGRRRLSFSSIASQRFLGTTRPGRVPLEPLEPHGEPAGARLARGLVALRRRSEGGVKPGSTPMNSNTRRRVSSGRGAELLLLDHQDLLERVVRAGTAAAACGTGCATT